MTQIFNIHPVNPQQRLIKQAVAALPSGGVIVFPTDSTYAVGCRLEDKTAVERIKDLRQLDKQHNFTLICRNLSELAIYAQVINPVFRLLKAYTPGPYTFILPASREVPKRLQHAKRKTIGLRIPANLITLALLEELNEPLMSVSLIFAGEQTPLSDPEEIYARVVDKVDVLIDGGPGDIQPSSVIDLVSGVPEVLRVGKGDVMPFK